MQSRLFLNGVLLASGTFVSLTDAEDYPPDVTRGKAVYERHCQTCHGIGGYGDGLEAAARKIQPANFHSVGSYIRLLSQQIR